MVAQARRCYGKQLRDCTFNADGTFRDVYINILTNKPKVFALLFDPVTFTICKNTSLLQTIQS